MFLRSGLVFGVFCLIVGSAVQGALPGPTVIVDPTPGPSHGFGTAVAATARSLYVGDPRALSRETGLVWAFPLRSRGLRVGRALLPPSGLAVRSFGAALAVDDHTLVVGAPGSPYVGSLDIGDVFVYRLRGQKLFLEAHLQPSDAIEGGRFGAAVAIEGDRLVVGAPGETPGYDLKQPGRFYVFERDRWGWQETQRVVGPDRGSVGTSVDISGDTIAVGDPNGPTSDRYQRGRVSVYRLGDWSLDLEAQLIGSDAGLSSTEHFGFRVALDGDTLAVSDPFPTTVGTVSVFQRTDVSWEAVDVVLPPTSAGEFGFALALDRDDLFVGAPWPVAGATRGRVFLCHRTGSSWPVVDTITPDPSLQASHFGASIAWSPRGLAAGAPIPIGRVLLYAKKRWPRRSSRAVTSRAVAASGGV